jgi:SAM-dependent methyltransferase
MKAVNQYYGRQLTAEEIAAGAHRDFVGGLWAEIGDLQFEFLQQQGLTPQHKLVDIGCGALRCGLPIIRYLDAGNYYGLDINASLIEAGQQELEKEELTSKQPHLLVNDKFELGRFGISFDFAIAQSLFTHLDMNLIVRCLVEVRKILKSDGKLYATFFLAPSPGHIMSIKHEPGGIITNYDTDPFHYSLRELEWLAAIAGFSAVLVANWNHPRSQKMLELSVVPWMQETGS